jgi:hypothetical protein
MKKTMSFTAVLSVLWFIACGPAEQKAETAPAAEVETPAASAMACYESRFDDGSVISLRYTEDAEGNIQGTLAYDFAQKDKSSGAITGKRNGDMIVADWQRSGEGEQQVEEVMIKLDGDKAFRATGELMAGPDGMWKLKDQENLNWGDPMVKADCGG